LRAAAEILKTAGALHVTALTLARVDHHSPETGRRSIEVLRQKLVLLPPGRTLK
jgi:hypothetical protein